MNTRHGVDGTARRGTSSNAPTSPEDDHTPVIGWTTNPRTAAYQTLHPKCRICRSPARCTLGWLITAICLTGNARPPATHCPPELTTTATHAEDDPA